MNTEVVEFAQRTVIEVNFREPYVIKNIFRRRRGDTVVDELIRHGWVDDSRGGRVEVFKTERGLWLGLDEYRTYRSHMRAEAVLLRKTFRTRKGFEEVTLAPRKFAWLQVSRIRRVPVISACEGGELVWKQCYSFEQNPS